MTITQKLIISSEILIMLQKLQKRYEDDSLLNII